MRFSKEKGGFSVGIKSSDLHLEMKSDLTLGYKLICPLLSLVFGLKISVTSELDINKNSFKYFRGLITESYYKDKIILSHCCKYKLYIKKYSIKMKC